MPSIHPHHHLLPLLLLLLFLLSITTPTAAAAAFLHPTSTTTTRSQIRQRLLLRMTATAPEEEDSSNNNEDELTQDHAPIMEALANAATRIKAPFFFPGHKMGRGLPITLAGPFLRNHSPPRQKGNNENENDRDSVWQYDLPEIPELDNLFAPEGPIQDAETLAAQAFGKAKRTWFLVNGSTAGVLAAILAVVRRHQQQHNNKVKSKVLLPRNVHKSAINALVLAGAEPVFLSPVYDAEWDICHGVPVVGGKAGTLEQLLEKEGGGEVAAVLLVSPTYHGALMDLEQAAGLCHKYNVTLIVDEAHGAHLSFLDESMPIQQQQPNSHTTTTHWRGALAAGADLVVQSTHKTLTAVSQCAMMHAGHGPQVDDALLEFVGSALQLVQSSSPNYVLLASLDGARWQLGASEGQGRAALRRAQELAGKARQRIKEETPFHVLDVNKEQQDEDEDGNGAFVGLDPLRLTVGLMGSGLSGFDADEVMIEEHGVYAELPASRTLTFAVGPGSVEEDVDRLVEALKALAESESEPAGDETSSSSSSSPSSSDAAAAAAAGFPSFDGQQAAARARSCTPREAYFTSSEVLSTEDDAIVGRASAETVCPYPPGIPVLLPGEIITVEVLRFLKGVLDAGGSVTGCSDPTLGKLRVLCL